MKWVWRVIGVLGAVSLALLLLGGPPKRAIDEAGRAVAREQAILRLDDMGHVGGTLRVARSDAVPDGPLGQVPIDFLYTQEQICIGVRVMCHWVDGDWTCAEVFWYPYHDHNEPCP